MRRPIKETNATAPSVGKERELAGLGGIKVAELAKDVDRLKVLKGRIRARRDFKGVRVVSEMIYTKRQWMEKFNLSNYGADS